MNNLHPESNKQQSLRGNYPMLYITNRAFNEFMPIIPGQNVTYKKGDVNPSTNSFYMYHDKGANLHRCLGENQWFTDFRNLHLGKHILFYVHGFNVTPIAALDGAAKLQAGLDSTKYLVIPFLWGCEDSQVNIAERYYSDRAKAEISSIALCRFFVYWKNMLSTTPVKASILTHSMGNRVFAYMFKEFAVRNQVELARNLFDSVFMCAADILNEALHPGQIGTRIPISAKNVIVASAIDDTALQVSGVFNYFDLESTGTRLGHTGMQNWTRCPSNCVDVNCSNVNQQTDSMGHSYFFPNSHLFKVIKKVLDTGNIFWDISQTRSGFLVENLSQGL
jgi:esterase/lipase superfamily enzyme